MKKIIPIICLSASMLLCCKNVLAQPMGSCTVLHQPCNNDGVLAVNITSGLVPPLTFTYSSSYNSIVHSNINALTDTLYGTSMCSDVYVTDNFGQGLYLPSGMIPPFTVDYPQITKPICPDTMGSVLFTINQGVMPDSVHWFVSAAPSFGPLIGEGNPMSLPLGDYMLVVTDSYGCTVIPPDSMSSVMVIRIESTSTINYTVNTSAASCTNGAASVNNITGGIPPYTYLWSNGANTTSINNLLQGYYEVTVSDSIGCSTSYYAYINQSPFINVVVSSTPATCLQNDGSAIAFASGGTPPYTYDWSSGMTGQTLNGLPGGTNQLVTATDANGCFGTGYAAINSSTPITASYTSTPSSCLTPTGSATLNISGGTNPYTILWNTYPPQNSISINNMPSGNYPFTITDAAGCIRTGTAHIDRQTVINASISVINPVCPATTGYLSANVSGSSPPFSFQWSNGSSTQAISNAPIGNYCCTITDNSGCQVVKCASVSSASPIAIGFSATPASCIYAQDGSLFALVNGGTAPYTYHWSNGQTANTATGLAAGNYSLNVQDAHGCSGNNIGAVGYDPNNDSCYCTIKGKVYADLNGNCIYDIIEQGISHVMVHCDNFGYAWTDANGDYSFIVPTGNYTLSENVLYIYPLAPCQSNSIPVSAIAGSGCISTYDFANTVNPLHDIHIITNSINQAVPGYSYNQGIIILNEGSVNEANIQIGYRHDGQLQYINTLPLPFTQVNPINDPDWYTINSGFTTLAPGASTMLFSNFQVPSNIPINTMIQFNDTTAYASPMSNWLTDYSPWTNIDNYYIYTVGSYDPNFKEVNPIGFGPQGNITTNDSVLDYIIHFQNIGNYYAQNIFIVDTLDDDLDWTTLKPGYSDHSYTVSMSEDGVLKFTFSNINLPYQNMSELGSRGLVTYTIRQKDQLAEGTEIKNTANIYFDFNAPVTTNTTLNTIDFDANLNEAPQDALFSFYPNPASHELIINLNDLSNANSISIYDIMGRLLIKENAAHTTTQTISIESLDDGIYFLVLQGENGVRKSAKFIKN